VCVTVLNTKMHHSAVIGKWLQSYRKFVGVISVEDLNRDNWSPYREFNSEPPGYEVVCCTHPSAAVAVLHFKCRLILRLWF
jgi:hypothetical protein